MDACDNQAMASALKEVAEQEKAQLIVVSNSNTGKSIIPRLAIKLDAALIANVIEIPSSNNPLTVKKSFFWQGIEIAQAQNDRCILAVSPNSFTSHEIDNTATIEHFDASQQKPMLALLTSKKPLAKLPSLKQTSWFLLVEG